MIDFLYNVITKENSVAADLAPSFWANHPDWEFFVRTNVRYSKNPRVWLGGGGKTLEEALRAATESVQIDAGNSMKRVGECWVMGPQEVKGIESPVLIRNDPEKR